ncbi:Stf0 family sulfotransferase [Alcanivorax sp.]|uniref:Stf0 family sulfotransferase n=1 Tax=Alcanivorax sp. TaxID=1872427 RepID=UPI0025C01A62|nr:Stf0 family sulfotransferase [Alcanivorax sp.]
MIRDTFNYGFNKAKKLIPHGGRRRKTALWMEQFEAVHDFSDFTGAGGRQYVICSTPRSGSHYLGHLLYSTGKFGYPLEYFNPVNIPFWQDRAGKKNHIDYILRKRTSPNGCFGIKLHWSQLELFCRFLDQKSGLDLSDFSFVFLTREDKLSQAVSAARAQQSGAYISDVEERGKLKYNRKLIQKKLSRTINDEASWRYFFALNDIGFLDLKFEDVCRSPDEAVMKIAKHVGIADSDIHVNQAYLKKPQSDNLNSEWKRRFIEESSLYRSTGKGWLG